MKYSQIVGKTKKEVSSEEESINAQLLIKGGFVQKQMAGVYAFLPLGLTVLQKVMDVIRDEMNKLGANEVLMGALQNKTLFEQTDRWDDEKVDVWFKTKLKNGGEVGLSFTNEEAYSNILKQYVSSYKDLPIYPYDFKSIFRNEVRSKSGIMRGREFYWKALYSFSKDEVEHNDFYEKMKTAYQNIFKKVGIGHITYITFASGGTFSQFSHEFQTLTGAGEDTIYLDETKGIAINKEVYDDKTIKQLDLNKEDLVKKIS